VWLKMLFSQNNAFLTCRCVAAAELLSGEEKC